MNYLTVLVAFVVVLAGLRRTWGAELTRVSNTTLSFPAQAPSGTFTTEVAFSSLPSINQATSIVSPPGDTNRLFIAQKDGRILVLTNLPNTTLETFLDITSMVDPQGECGLLGLAFHPSYATNGYFYIFYSFSNGGNLYQRLARMSVSVSNPNRADASSEVPMITQEDDQNNHNGGDLHFGPDGYLYVSLGDEGGANDQYDNGRFIDKDFFSGMMRLDVDQKPGSLTPNSHASVHSGTYSIPPDNPYMGLTSYMGFTTDPVDIRTEFWASGFRNPWRFCFDPPTGRLLCADVGQGGREEVNLVTCGNHYGWSYREGTADFNIGPGGATPPSGFAPVDPIHDYPRSEGHSITGGRVYRGDRFSELYGAYIFGDYGSNRVWAMYFDAGGGVDRVDYLLNVTNVAAFGTDPTNGDILAASYNGHVYRIVRATATPSPSIPTTLSATGAFSDLTGLIPNAGIVPYETNVSFWSDNAVKQRWFSIPSLADTMVFAENVPWSFPTGQVWIKHFELDLTPNNSADAHRRLETRFLVKTADGIYGVTYRWNGAQSDADLVSEEGMDESLTIQSTGGPTMQTWRYPSRSECLSCHSPAAGHVLGFTTEQLNREISYGGAPCNQLAALSDAGYFDTPLEHVYALPALAAHDDLSQSLEHRARSYLSVNCAPCHREDGYALGSWDGRNLLTTAEANLVNGGLVNDLGNTSMRVIAPGSIAHSMVITRMLGSSAPRMPPLASNVVDTVGMQLISDWITNELPSWQSYEEWQNAHFVNPQGPEATRSADPDGDARTNEFEFLTRTLPWDSQSLWDLQGVLMTDHHQVDYSLIAGRAAIVELSADAVTWVPWNHPNNRRNFQPMPLPSSQSVPIGSETRQFIRVRFLER